MDPGGWGGGGYASLAPPLDLPMTTPPPAPPIMARGRELYDVWRKERVAAMPLLVLYKIVPEKDYW